MTEKIIDLAKDAVILGVCLAGGIGMVVALYTSPLWMRRPKK